MAIHPLAGKPAPADILIDVAALERAYYQRKPDVDDPAQLVSFGTSGHRGSPLSASFNEAHILAITQAICEYRASRQSPGRSSWAKIPMRAPGRRSGPRSKCWRRKASTRSFSGRRLHADDRRFRARSCAQPRQERPPRRRHRRHAVA